MRYGIRYYNNYPAGVSETTEYLESFLRNLLLDEDVLDERGKVVLEKLQPIIYDEEQVRYLSIGETVSDAFRPGTELKSNYIHCKGSLGQRL